MHAQHSELTHSSSSMDIQLGSYPVSLNLASWIPTVRDSWSAARRALDTRRIDPHICAKLPSTPHLPMRAHHGQASDITPRQHLGGNDKEQETHAQHAFISGRAAQLSLTRLPEGRGTTFPFSLPLPLFHSLSCSPAYTRNQSDPLQDLRACVDACMHMHKLRNKSLSGPTQSMQKCINEAEAGGAAWLSLPLLLACLLRGMGTCRHALWPEGLLPVARSCSSSRPLSGTLSLSLSSSFALLSGSKQITTPHQ